VSLTEGLPYGPDVRWRRLSGSIHPGGAGGSPAPGACGQGRTRRGRPVRTLSSTGRRAAWARTLANSCGSC